jgi:hypothetical protein
MRWDKRHEILERDVGAEKPHGPAISIPQVKAGGFQPAIFFQQANAILPPPGQGLDQLLGQVQASNTTTLKGALC